MTMTRYRQNVIARIIFKKMVHSTDEWMSNCWDRRREACLSAAEDILAAIAQDAAEDHFARRAAARHEYHELHAAYERITELGNALLAVRATLRDEADPFDLIEKAISTIDHTLDERVVAP